MRIAIRILNKKCYLCAQPAQIIELHPKPNKIIKELKLAEANRILCIPVKKAEVINTEDRGGDKNGT